MANGKVLNCFSRKIANFVFLHPNQIAGLKEYGSNIQKLVGNMVNIEDREQRTRYAHILVELMRQIHPNMKDGQDYYNKLWDDLYIISGFTLDVDSPYPPPSEESLGKAPQPVPYNTHSSLRFKHFGYNMTLLVNKAIAVEDPEERRAFVSYLFRLMKSFYTTWNKESVEDETIYQSLLEVSNGKLRDDIELIRSEGLVESTPRERAGDQTQPQRINQNQRGNNRQGYGNFGQGNRQGGQRPGQRNTGPNNAGGRGNNPGGRGNNPGNRPNNPGPGGRNNPNNGGNRNDFRGNNNRRRR